MYTQNRKTNNTGVAFFNNKEKKITVFEGKDDGSDDKEMSYDDFIEDYWYQVQNEKTQETLSSLDILNYNSKPISVLSEIKALKIAIQIQAILQAKKQDWVNYNFVEEFVKQNVEDYYVVDDIILETINILEKKLNIEYNVDMKI